MGHVVVLAFLIVYNTTIKKLSNRGRGSGAFSHFMGIATVPSLCRLLPETGTPVELAKAHRQLIELHAWFSEGLDTRDLQEVATLIRETSDSGLL